ncbi:MAG: hypothetical protein R6W93_07620 [Candidatus Limnocylindrales bacterium]
MITAEGIVSVALAVLTCALVGACGSPAAEQPGTVIDDQASVAIVTGPSPRPDERSVCTGDDEIIGARLRYWYDLYLELPDGRLLAVIWPAGTRARFDEQGVLEVVVSGETIHGDERIDVVGGIRGDRAYVCEVTSHAPASRTTD